MAHGNVSVALRGLLWSACLYVQRVELTVTHFILSSQSLSLSLSIGSSWETLSRHVGVSRYVENVGNERRHLDLFENDQC